MNIRFVIVNYIIGLNRYKLSNYNVESYLICYVEASSGTQVSPDTQVSCYHDYYFNQSSYQ